MGNTNDSSTSSESDSDDDNSNQIITSDVINKGIIDIDKEKERNKGGGGGGITSGVKSMFGGIKNYLTGKTESEIQKLDKYGSRYASRAVFVKLSAPNYYFANQV